MNYKVLDVFFKYIEYYPKVQDTRPTSSATNTKMGLSTNLSNIANVVSNSKCTIV